MEFNNRVFGCVVVKSINSNYNADFSGQPRTLPDGTVYATDKALKYAIRNYWMKMFPSEKIFYFTQYDDNGNPLTLDNLVIRHFGMFPTKKIQQEKGKGKTKKVEEVEVLDKVSLKNKLLECIDIKCFGATYAGKTNISIHGAVQINHGINIWKENNIFSEQIKSPVATEEGDEMTTIGRSVKLQEGHYLHHFSINPINTENKLTSEDIAKLKEAMCKGVTYYDSAAKAGTDNELLIWIQLKKESKIVLPNINSLIKKEQLTKENSKLVFDLSEVSNLVKKYEKDIEKYEVYYQKENTKIINGPVAQDHFDLN
ncbi:MAG: hypothetical protein PETM_02692 [Petrimonas sp.]|jgi:CRISPR-associated protein Csh2|uniref:type I CRISPR-associated protein Cas7 n=1 Tax=Petrimonas sp. TaxID=2023866 RepID=UPI002A4A0A99|nr:type I CRISPR-associated protein Cas7 [Bacteroidales bacterium]MDD3939622.1 type I CRISPR-associated protein Cas7 [Patescibacteria group bacterium]